MAITPVPIEALAGFPRTIKFRRLNADGTYQTVQPCSLGVGGVVVEGVIATETLNGISASTATFTIEGADNEDFLTSNGRAIDLDGWIVDDTQGPVMPIRYRVRQGPDAADFPGPSSSGDGLATILTLNGDAVIVAAGQGAPGRDFLTETFTPTGGTTARLAEDILSDSLGVKNFGVTWNNVGNTGAQLNTALTQLLANYTASTPGINIPLPQGLGRATTPFAIDLADFTGAGRINIQGEGMATTWTAGGAANVVELTNEAGTSCSMMVHDFRVGTGSGQDANTTFWRVVQGSTQLDMMFSNIYVNGISNGWWGSSIHTKWSGIYFDFMPGVGIRHTRSDFRKYTITSCTFYACELGGIRLFGDLAEDDGATLTEEERETAWDNGRGAGYGVISGCLFDRPYSTSTESQRQIWLRAHNAVTISNCTFNGKTPDQVQGTTEFIRLEDCRAITITGFAGDYCMASGIYISGQKGVEIAGILRRANQNGSSTIGSIYIVDSEDIDLNMTDMESGGVAVYLLRCNNVSGAPFIRGSAKAGLVIDTCNRVTLSPRIYDANQGGAASGDDSCAIVIKGTSSGIDILDTRCTVSSTSQGQVTNISIGASVTSCQIMGGRVSSFKTGGAAISDASGVAVVRDVAGITTRATGQATILNGTSSITFAHGLWRNPQAVKVVANYVSGDRTIFPLAITTDATNITLTGAANSSGNTVINWSATTE